MRENLRWTGWGILAMLALACSSGGNDDDTLLADDDDDTASDDDDDTADDDDDAADPFVEPPLIRYVDPFIGTGGIGFGVGSTYPGPAMPFGMIHAGPDTSTGGRSPGINHCVGYWHRDVEIVGFSHTRLNGIGVPDLGAVLAMPVPEVSDAVVLEENYRSPFDKAAEHASAGYYGVTLDNGGIAVELTTGLWAAMHRYRFPGGVQPNVLLDLMHTAGEEGRVESPWIHVAADGRITGRLRYSGGMSGREIPLTIHFAARLDRPIAAVRPWTADGLAELDSTEVEGEYAGCAFTLTEGEGPVHLKIAVSFIDEAAALANLDAEIPDWDFEGLRAEAEAAWESVLGAVRVAGGTEAQRRIFYTALYHAYLMPTRYTESDGRYMGFDQQPHAAEGFVYHSDLSLWDTFRSFHPFINLMDPEHARDFAVSLTTMIEQGGAVPRWPAGTGYTGSMIGSSADNVLAETWLKGITDWDAETAYAACKRQALEPRPAGARGPWRGGIESYMALGYIPGDVSVTAEYAYNDWALAGWAEALGKTEEAAAFRERSGHYANLWDESTGFLRARDAEGAFLPNFNPLAMWFTSPDESYTEGDAWHWTFYAPHDSAGLARLMGGEEAMAEKLSFYFEESAVGQGNGELPINSLPDNYYWHGNEPTIHSAYLFNDVGRPDLAQHWVREVMASRYGDGPDGLPGNDDGGTMSAWYLFSALGFYPQAGGTVYWVGSPVFTRAILHRPGGDLAIEAPGASDRARYVRSLRIDGEPIEGRFDHAAIRDGGLMEFEMAEEP